MDKRRSEPGAGCHGDSTAARHPGNGGSRAGLGEGLADEDQDPDIFSGATRQNCAKAVTAAFGIA
jgi:hypothetical protein